MIKQFKIKEFCRGRKSIELVWALVFLGCLFVILMTSLRLPQPQPQPMPSSSSSMIGAFGSSMIKMLPEGVAFTVFVPSETAVDRDLKEDTDDEAVVSRVVGFSAVPRTVSSAHVAIGEELCYDSISGFELCISKDQRGRLVVNNVVPSQALDLHVGHVVVHVMDGVVMDAEFQDSLQPDDD